MEELFKKCSKCGEVKNISEYAKMKNSPMGVRPDCKKCKYALDKLYRIKNSDAIKEKSKIKQQAITDQVNKRREIQLQKLKDKYIGLHLGDSIYITKYVGYLKEFPTSRYTRHYFEKECKNCNKSSNLTPGTIEKYIKCGTECQYCKGTIRKNESGEIEKRCKDCESWLPMNYENFGMNKNGSTGFNYYCKICKNKRSVKDRENPEVRKREYQQKNQRRKTDSLFRLKCSIRTIVRAALKRGFTKKSKRTEEIIGCTFEELKVHFENQFESWMTWENYGKYNGELNYGWDIDHIVPLCTAKVGEDMIKLNHYTNLQPLCSYTNRHIKAGKENFEITK